jgi:hypothetical protein
MLPVSRLMITVGIDAKGSARLEPAYRGREQKALCRTRPVRADRVTSPDGKVRTAEIPIGALGWEYDLIVT